MTKQLRITYDDKDYILEYNRRTVQQMEARGFNIQDIDSKPTTVLPMLFYGAFRVHHPSIRQKETDEILAHLEGREDLFTKLAEMYNTPAMELLEEPEKGAEGNASWTTNW